MFEITSGCHAKIPGHPGMCVSLPLKHTHTIGLFKKKTTIDYRTGVWIPFVVRHVSCLFSLAGLMVIFRMFHVYTPCSVRIFNYSHSDRILGREFGLEKWLRIEWYQALEHVRRATACASCSSLDWPPVRKVGWGGPWPNGVRMWNVTRWCSTVSQGGFVHYRHL
jgi:hypothetical protein